MIYVAAFVAALVSIYAIAYVIGRRRRTPDWSWNQEFVPAIEDLQPALAGLTRSPIYEGNQVEVFTNGAIFEPLLDDIDNARHSVHLETFVWWGGDLEQRVAETLIQAAGRGVTVRVIVDGVGSMKRTTGVFDKMRAAGIGVEVFTPVRPWTVHRFNERTHRKLLIVDGRVGYTMGHGIGDEWLGDGRRENEFRDTGVRVTGPAVHGLQSVFAENWTSLSCELMLCGQCFPALEPRGDTPVMVVSSSAGDDYSHVEIGFTAALASARNEILIQNPYFAPDSNVVKLLCETAQRGVAITLMVPGDAIDAQVLRRAARHLYPRMIDAGVRVLEYEPTLSHQKVMIVDQSWSRIGSTNLDCRSLELNEEAGVFIFSQRIAQQLRAQFFSDARYCAEVTRQACQQRSLPGRLCDAGAYLIHGQL